MLYKKINKIKFKNEKKNKEYMGKWAVPFSLLQKIVLTEEHI